MPLAIDVMINEYLDRISRNNKPTKGDALIGVTIPAGTKFKVINVNQHETNCTKPLVCLSEYVGKIGTFNNTFSFFNKNGCYSSGKYEEAYMNAIDKKNGRLCWACDEIEIIW